LFASSELGLQELIDHLQSFLIENNRTWMEQNFNLIYKMSFESESFLKLKNFCIELISREPEETFNLIDFISMSEKCLISLIQNDNFQMNVVQVWEQVLEWGIAQSPELPSDPSSYSKEDFNTLKDTLQQCIPFINFYNLTPKEFAKKVYPYKKIIPKELREKLIRDFIYQPNNDQEPKITKEIRSRSIYSRIIKYQHAEVISKWIDRLEITDDIKNSYEFKLILRGSRDGFSPGKFHEKCDNKSQTITIIKVKDSNEILGGYNPIVWKSDDGYGTTKDSFIFSFKDKDNIEDYILSRVKNEKYAISYYSNDDSGGPAFGNSDLDLYGNNCYNESWCHHTEYYDKPIRDNDNYFSVEEYEIFQIIKD
jgi:hypothetical protein